MKTQVCLSILIIFTILLIVTVVPFLPGKYDPLSIPLATFAQLYSGLGLLTTIPAVLWLLRNIKYPTDQVGKDSPLLKQRIYLKFYFWSSFLVFLIITLVTALGLSLLLGIFSLIFLIYFGWTVWKKITGSKSRLLFSLCLPSALALLPVLLFAIHLLLDKPLTKWSRNRAIQNSYELINEIEQFREKKGGYPPTLNAINKDYSTGVSGIEKYYYTYDGSTYNVYFEQPRFLFDRPGTREFVVYNPDDRHLMLSHTVWHMIMAPTQMRNSQGWYESVETGVPHWKSFLFD